MEASCGRNVLSAYRRTGVRVRWLGECDPRRRSLLGCLLPLLRPNPGERIQRNSNIEGLCQDGRESGIKALRIAVYSSLLWAVCRSRRATRKVFPIFAWCPAACNGRSLGRSRGLKGAFTPVNTRSLRHSVLSQCSTEYYMSVPLSGWTSPSSSRRCSPRKSNKIE